ncbi:IQ-domain 11 [Hibiscus trionum]|uniref:IQ-domain 11 n=1 Tax=Hibiscus trionum TaxID=183268 RepID=A0A9W7I1R1_HIBTR|nr:IQ-domain 11 [Hibiscus trionum]
MAKKKSWFNLLKRFFLFETVANAQKEKRRNWMFGRFRTKRLPSLKASSPPRDSTKCETEEEQKKHAAALNLKTNHEYASQGEREEKTLDAPPDSSSSSELERKFQELAATKIQAAFRGYLARKALRALKGVVRLQAIIRGWVVRRQALTTLKCLQSIVNIQTQVCARRFQMVEGAWQDDENRQLLTFKDKIIKVDDSISTKEEADAINLTKKEGAIKRQVNSIESKQKNDNGGLMYWIDQWADAKTKQVWTSNLKPTGESRCKQLGVKTFPIQYHCDAEGAVPIRRRSFHGKQCSLGEDRCFATSPVLPTYMAATQSAKAKVRSMSSPKLRPDAESESYSPYKNKLCIISSVTSRPSTYQQRSPTLKGFSSKQSFKDVSFNSECSLPNWMQKRTFK